MTKHIGIVACSAEGAALCYTTICVNGFRHLGPHAHPEVSLHTHSLAEYVACLDRGDIEGIGNLMLSSAVKLRAAGAEFLICPDNTIHQAMDYVTTRSPLPWLHIVDVVAAEAAARGYGASACLEPGGWSRATSTLRNSEPAKLSASALRPPRGNASTRSS
jgi:aspartate racemase